MMKERSCQAPRYYVGRSTTHDDHPRTIVIIRLTIFLPLVLVKALVNWDDDCYHYRAHRHADNNRSRCSACLRCSRSVSSEESTQCDTALSDSSSIATECALSAILLPPLHAA